MWAWVGLAFSVFVLLCVIKEVFWP